MLSPNTTRRVLSLVFIAWTSLIATSAPAQNIEWIRQFGTPEHDLVQGLGIDSSGIYVTGWSAVAGQNAYAVNAVVNKFDSAGNGLWTRQFGPLGFGSEARRVATNSTGIYVVGYTEGDLPGQTHTGDWS